MSTDSAVGDVAAERLAEVALKIRDAREALYAKFKSEDSVLREQEELVESKILELCKELGAASIRTNAGTIVRRVSTRYWTTDWGRMFEFMKEHDVPLFEQRIHQTNMKQFLEENPDKLPVGLQADSKYTIVVRRSKS